ncbi:hypothetical protein TRIUR3_19164 [Triticum urartu]|uniref:Uncharacterized protein n=1 Tax=Triticum urartu TaxID=4572 RepID=M8AP81_TRIUA|nr:hypothetical protein TRIUR3_19164 [Triticum urartu]
MASGGSLMTKKELGETHDVLRFGVNDSVHGDLALAHPVQATIKRSHSSPGRFKMFRIKGVGSATRVEERRGRKYVVDGDFKKLEVVPNGKQVPSELNLNTFMLLN